MSELRDLLVGRHRLNRQRNRILSQLSKFRHQRPRLVGIVFVGLQLGIEPPQARGREAFRNGGLAIRDDVDHALPVDRVRHRLT